MDLVNESVQCSHILLSGQYIEITVATNWLCSRWLLVNLSDELCLNIMRQHLNFSAFNIILTDLMHSFLPCSHLTIHTVSQKKPTIPNVGRFYFFTFRFSKEFAMILFPVVLSHTLALQTDDRQTDRQHPMTIAELRYFVTIVTTKIMPRFMHT